MCVSIPPRLWACFYCNKAYVCVYKCVLLNDGLYGHGTHTMSLVSGAPRDKLKSEPETTCLHSSSETAFVKFDMKRGFIHVGDS